MYVSVRLCINYIITITKWLSRSAWQCTEEAVVVNQCNLEHQTSMTECLLHLKESLWIDVLDLWHANVKSLFKTASQKKPKYFCPLYRQKWVFSAPGWATFTTGREVRERKKSCRTLIHKACSWHCHQKMKRMEAAFAISDFIHLSLEATFL